MSMLMQMLMGRLRNQNPQAFSQINNAMNSGANPKDFMQQMMKNGNISPEQMSSVLNQAKSMNVPDEVLREVQNINK